MFNQPVSNALAGTLDPFTGQDACPITARTSGMVGMIPTCPHFEADGVTESPLEGQAIIANLYPGLYEVVAHPAPDRIARGEEWLQTNTLDGTPAHEAFIKPDEPSYFQEFGPGPGSSCWECRQPGHRRQNPAPSHPAAGRRGIHESQGAS